LDLIISPVSIGEKPPRISDILNQKDKKNPVFEYKMDYYTAFPNITGSPAITMPIMETDSKYEPFPSSFKLQGYFGEDYHLLRIALKVEEMLKQAQMHYI
jgi:Asp-tRNA(Asn)/Glu-tRNA(Gln) amidotransferase A subunit family amidase